MVDADERDGKLHTVRLYEVRGETSVYIDAEISEEGNLVVSGQDIGKLPENIGAIRITSTGSWSPRSRTTGFAGP